MNIKNDFHFKKKFGQNFISDSNIINSMVNQLNIDNNTLVIEIGPGSGALTTHLASLAGNVLCYEIDTDLKETLDDNLSDFNNVNVIYNDFLKADVNADIKKYNYKKLYLVANLPYYITTPIGNMQDITLRAIDTLKMVDVIFSEDTRVTRELLTSLNIDKKLISSHNFNESKNLDKLLMYLKNNQNVGIVTDRGTPIISDPGYELVKCAIENHYNVVGLPGPTALIPALITSGIDPSPFMFYGFLSTKEYNKRIRIFKRLSIYNDFL
jgi:hypothetical protein